MTIWVPFGLGLRASRNEFGISYADGQKRLTIDFTTLPATEVGRHFAALVNATLSEGALIHYEGHQGRLVRDLDHDP